MIDIYQLQFYYWYALVGIIDLFRTSSLLITAAMDSKDTQYDQLFGTCPCFHSREGNQVQAQKKGLTQGITSGQQATPNDLQSLELTLALA